MSLTEDKKALRKEINARFKICSAEVLTEKSKLALNKLELDPAFMRAKTILLYWSRPDEVNTHIFIEKWAKKRTILLPSIYDGKMQAHLYEGKQSMIIGSYEILQPQSPKYMESIDLVIVPGRAFNTNGHRLGRGKGFYDDFLKDFKGIKIGLCFDFQLENSIPFESFDIIMDKVITD